MRAVRVAIHSERVRCTACRGLLLDALDLHWAQIAIASGFDECLGIGGVGFVAPDVGAHVLWRKQNDFDTSGAEGSRPVEGRAAGFHDDALDRAVVEKARELCAREAVTFDDAMIGIGERELEDVFCQIDGDGCRMHVGLLSFVMLTPHP